MSYNRRNILYLICVLLTIGMVAIFINFQTDRFLVVFSFVLFACIIIILNSYILYKQILDNRKNCQLSVSQEVLYLASEVASDGIFEWNLISGKAFYSRQYWAILGYLPNSFPATIKSFNDLLHPEDKENVLDYIRQYLSGQLSEYHITFRMKHKEGNWVWIDARGQALYGRNGVLNRIVGAHTDITLVKAYEEKLETAKKDAEKANRAKTDFLAHMSHEIRTPLTAISGIAEIFNNDKKNFNEKQKNLIKVLVSSTSSLKDLVSDILDFSKIENGDIELDLVDQTFSLQDVFEQIISIISLNVYEKSFDFNFDYSLVKNKKFLGDRGRFRQILLNLIGNSIKFTEKGIVNVTAKQQIMPSGERFLCVDVEDTGIGIENENLELIFERFKQADSSISRKYGGSGLGLPISLRLARLMGGDIKVESTLGKGSIFSLMLPFKNQLKDDDIETNKEDIKDYIYPSLKGKAVLLVEDYEGNIEVLSYILESFECDFDVARTGFQAVDMWEVKDYDLILMDVQMPKMDGFTATHLIRQVEKEKNRKHTPIIGMTAHALIGDREKCIEVGMDTYLPKPLVESDLKEKIIEFIGRV